MARLNGLLPILSIAALVGAAGFTAFTASIAQAQPSGPEGATTTSSTDAIMEAGVAALPTNPVAAARSFRTVLERMPTHYGAAFQLAVALDRLGENPAAQAQWLKVVRNAEAVGDTETAATARERAAASGIATLMSEGVELLYERRDPARAVEVFRRVLQEVPTHYGANFQMARALDAAGKSKEAIPIWTSVLDAATKAEDRDTMRAARMALSGDEITSLMEDGVKARLAGSFGVAEQRLRRVLVLLPDHYGATYQLAATLDAAGRPSEGTPLWQVMTEMARSAGDEETLAVATQRLTATR